MIIVSWDVPGINHLSKQHRVKDALSAIRLNWIGIQESKNSDVDSIVISQLLDIKMLVLFFPSVRLC